MKSSLQNGAFLSIWEENNLNALNKVQNSFPVYFYKPGMQIQ